MRTPGVVSIDDNMICISDEDDHDQTAEDDSSKKAHVDSIEPYLDGTVPDDVMGFSIIQSQLTRHCKGIGPQASTSIRSMAGQTC